MSIYTKGGDLGETGLFGNQRVRKNHARVDAYGCVDELNAFLGLLRAEPLPPERDDELREIQDTLFEVGADLATPGGNASLARVAAGTAELEGWIDRDDGQLPQLRTFVLPGGHREAALFHVLRVVCRRAERQVWGVIESEDVPTELGTYLNRLSDLFFVWARYANRAHGVPDVPWRRRET